MIGLGLSLGFSTALSSALPYSFNGFFGIFWQNTGITVTRQEDGTYTSNYNPENDKPTGTTLYCTKTGNDTTGNGSFGNPYRTPQKCYNEGADIINIGAGFWDQSDAFSADFSPTRDLAIVGNKDVYLTRAYNGLSATLDSGNVYVLSGITGVANIVDITRVQSTSQETQIDGVTGVPIPFSIQDSKANVEANEYSWYDDGVDTYIHAAGGNTPDFDNVKVLSDDNIINIISGNDSNTLYVEGLEIWGNRPLRFKSGDVSGTLCVGVDTGFRYGNTGTDAVEIDDVNTRFIRCQATDTNDADGFNYHRIPSRSYTTYHFEDGCYGARNGWNATGIQNDNGTTTHDAVIMLRINGVCRENRGGNYADVTGAMVYNLGCRSFDSLGGASGAEEGFTCGSLSAGYSGIVYYQDCVDEGSTRGFNRGTGCLSIHFTGNVGTKVGTFIDGTDPANIDAAILADNTVAPAVTGTETVGQELSCTTGTWTGLPLIVYAYQWQASANGGDNWINIIGGTGNTYTLQASDEGKIVRCVVTAQVGTQVDPDILDTTTANSNATGVISAASFLPSDLAELNGWFDPSDTDNVTTSGGNATVITDLSGGTNMTARVAAAYGSRTINGLNVLDYDKGENYAVAIDYTSGHDIFMVIDFDDVTTVNFIRSVTSGVFRSNLNSSANINTITPGSNLTGSDVLTTGTPYILYLRASASGNAIYVNGGTGSTNASDAGLTANLDTFGGASFGYEGGFGEICTFEATLTTSELNQVGNYLADKWGVTWTDIT